MQEGRVTDLLGVDLCHDTDRSGALRPSLLLHCKYTVTFLQCIKHKSVTSSCLNDIEC